MTGVDTVVADDPMLTDRSGLRRRRPLLRVVLDSALRMPLDSKMVNTANNDVVIFTVTKDEARIRQLTERGVRVEVLPAEAGRVPLGKVLDQLGKEGILTLLTETGTRLNTALLAGGPGGPRSPFCLAADHGLRRRAGLSRHAQCHPHGPGGSGALRQRPRSLLAAARPVAAGVDLTSPRLFARAVDHLLVERDGLIRNRRPGKLLFDALASRVPKPAALFRDRPSAR